MATYFVTSGFFLIVSVFISHIVKISGNSYLIHSNVTLRCNTTKPGKSLWTDDCNNPFQTIIYFAHKRHSVLPKYDNFFLGEDGTYDLTIWNTVIEDEGCYECKTDEFSLAQETLKIEVPPTVQLIIAKSTFSLQTTPEMTTSNIHNGTNHSDSSTTFATVLSTVQDNLPTTLFSNGILNGSTFSIMENESVDIFCHAYGSRPAVILSLQTNLQKELFNVSSQETSFYKKLYNCSNHHVMVIQRKHRYLACRTTGQESVGSVTTNIFLDVHYEPSCTITVIDVTVRCTCVANPPVRNGNYQIFLNGKIYTNDSMTTTRGLSGEVKCVGSNVYGSASSDIILVGGLWTTTGLPKYGWILIVVAIVILSLTGFVLVKRRMKDNTTPEKGNDTSPRSCKCCPQLCRRGHGDHVTVDYKSEGSVSTNKLCSEGNTLGTSRYNIPTVQESSPNKVHSQSVQAFYDNNDPLSFDEYLDDMIVADVGSKSPNNTERRSVGMSLQNHVETDGQTQEFGSSTSVYEVASVHEVEGDVTCDEICGEDHYPVDSSEIYELDDVDINGFSDQDEYDRVLYLS